MAQSAWLLNSSAVLLLCGMFFCSGFDESTDLGSGLINGVYHDKVTIGKHFKEITLDSSFCTSRSSVPLGADTGFGVHQVTSGNMVLGTYLQERSVALVEFFCGPDSAPTKLYSANDTLQSIEIWFSRDTTGPSGRVVVFRAADRDEAMRTSLDSADTLHFIGTAADSVPIGSTAIVDSVFQACRDTVKDSASAFHRFAFALVNPDSGPLLRLDRNGRLIVTVKRDTSHIRIVYPAKTTTWFVEERDRSLLDTVPVSSFASKRTAVFRYRVDSLWRAIGDTSSRAQFLSAGFVVKGPTTDSLWVQGLLTTDTLHDGASLDASFRTVPVQLLAGTSMIFANVKDSLRLSAIARPSSLFFYVRLASPNQAWKSVTWTVPPSLETVVTIP